MHLEDEARFEMTLDPPGKIVVVGAGALGLEAALYGRYLGYEVELFERGIIGESLRGAADSVLPMLPDRCLSPLAISALKAQDGGLVLPGDPTFPQTIHQWIENGLLRIASTDLLAERIHLNCEVVSISHVLDGEQHENDDSEAAAEDEDSYVDGEVPPDFRLLVRTETGDRSVETEAVIFAIGETSRSSIEGLESLMDAPYLFEVGRAAEGNDEARLHRGWHEIVMVYAGLGGRRSLDLYRPIRS
jgi:hypothetical protein